MRVTDFQALSELEPNRKHHRARVRDRLWLKKASQVFPQEPPRVKLQEELFLDSGKFDAFVNYLTYFSKIGCHLAITPVFSLL
jgi:hypothetical protein